jgi:hypothetical protein
MRVAATSYFKSEKDALRWLLSFAVRDLDAMSAAELVTAAIAAFEFVSQTQDYESVLQFVFSIGSPPGEEDFKKDPQGRAFVYTPEQLRIAHVMLKSGLRLMRAGNAWRVPAVGMVVRLSPHGAQKIYSGEPAIQFVARSVELLVAHWNDIRTCASSGCGNLFLPVGRQIHCCRKCANTAKWANYIEKHKKRPRDYRAEYEARLRKKTYSNVKVTGR